MKLTTFILILLFAVRVGTSETNRYDEIRKQFEKIEAQAFSVLTQAIHNVDTNLAEFIQSQTFLSKTKPVTTNTDYVFRMPYDAYDGPLTDTESVYLYEFIKITIVERNGSNIVVNVERKKQKAGEPYQNPFK